VPPFHLAIASLFHRAIVRSQHRHHHRRGQIEKPMSNFTDGFYFLFDTKLISRPGDAGCPTAPFEN
jgi:hypothetical protein